jgi:hypothetical protein
LNILIPFSFFFFSRSVFGVSNRQGRQPFSAKAVVLADFGLPEDMALRRSSRRVRRRYLPNVSERDRLPDDSIKGKIKPKIQVKKV